ncbi:MULTISPECIES: MaoC family dehydratase N-terminal domain-containing protein [Micrococcaceae]|uniref:FAS1-like dehydratase domain-containing protein n=1 Tax=Micrococcaceae TaxID=1268 RepID=UPI001035BA7F|nr:MULTISPECIES: MaoC family dehydratase N-terminal domain-containing protein [Micrococcaceae]TAP27934.1 MaoC family dehydratase [Arthrobacter sp. S41]UXN33266.1 MaoC family dehydratase N-terminal domain-containing protein [Glutamicibacter sp. M10]
MGINPDLVGRVFPAGESYHVGREKIREFATATKATSPAHFKVEEAQKLGYSDVVAPPTFAIIVAQRADAQLIADPASGIDFSRVVHADQRFTHHRPIVAGDELIAELYVDQVREMGAGAMITTRAEISSISGEKVATTVSSLLVRAED